MVSMGWKINRNIEEGGVRLVSVEMQNSCKIPPYIRAKRTPYYGGLVARMCYMVIKCLPPVDYHGIIS